MTSTTSRSYTSDLHGSLAPTASVSKAWNVPFFDGAAVNSALDVMDPIKRVVAHGCYVLGQEVEDFEKNFAQYLNAHECIGVNSGTDALELALKALGVGSKSRVLMVANAAFYGSAAAYNLGAEPVYVDVVESTACMDPEKLESALQNSGPYHCLIVTHLYGQMADIANIVEVAKKYNIPVIEDCAQAHGATVEGQKAGTWGNLATFSFYPTKNLGALGDGGAVIASTAKLAQKVRSLRQYGWKEKYLVALAGGKNSRLDAIQAAVLTAKLKHLDEANEQRQKVAQLYQQAFDSLPIATFAKRGPEFVAHLYVITCAARDELSKHLATHKIATLIHFPVPDHLQPAYACKQQRGDLPVTERLSQTVLSLPCYPYMPASHVEQVISAVHTYFKSSKARQS